MIDRTDLRLVLAIKDCGSLVAAADKMDVTAAAVTKRLALLETRLAVKLFRRTTRSVNVTPEGELYCGMARKLLEDFESLEARVTEQASEPIGTIKIACNAGFGRMWAGPAVEEFCRLYPQVEVELHLRNQLPDLQAEGFDAALWLWQPHSTQWIIQKLAANHRIVVAAPSYLKAHGAPAAPQDLTQHACLLMLERDMPQNLWHLSLIQGRGAKTVDVRVAGRLRSNNGDVIRDWALSGAGIAIRPLWDVHAHVQRGRLVHLLPRYAKLDSDVQWIAPYRQHLPRRVRLLKEFFGERLKAAPWMVPLPAAT
jgi:LysR family transcriptional regulator, transcriptional activator for dmlA